MSFNIKWTNSNPIVTYSGVVNFEIISNSNNVIIGDARFDDMKYQIFDHSGVEKFMITQKELEMIGVLDKNSAVWNKKVKVALIFNDIKIEESIRKYLEIMAQTQWKVKVFDNYKEAEKWCNEQYY